MSRFLAVFALTFVCSTAAAQDLDARIAARLENRVSKVEQELAALKAEFHKLTEAPKLVSQDTPKVVRKVLMTTSGHQIEQQLDGTYRYVGTPPVIQYTLPSGSPCANGRCPR